MVTKTMAHFGNTGDILASLPAMREFYVKTGIKPTLYLVKDHPAEYYTGAVHPVKNEAGQNVSLNEGMISMLIPLLKEQDYLQDVLIKESVDYNPEEIDVNLSFTRDNFCNIPFGDIRRWYFYCFPDLACDLSKQYIHVPDSEKDLAKGKIIICRTERYQNETLDYSFLKEYEDDLLFSGTMREYNNFCMQFDINIRKLSISNFLELAQAIKQAKALMSNQTMIFQIAEGLKTPRVVELCSYAPNVIPTGEMAFDFYSQTALEMYFHTLNGTYGSYATTYKQENPANIAG